MSDKERSDIDDLKKRVAELEKKLKELEKALAEVANKAAPASLLGRIKMTTPPQPKPPDEIKDT